MERSADYLGATGIGVTNLERSAAFYIDALGMKQVMTFKLPEMDEIILSHPGRSALVLMHWTDGSAQNYLNLPVKLVFYVTDINSVTARIRAAGFEVTRDPTPAPGLGNALVAFGKDPDGYVLELIQPAAKA